MQYIAPGTDVQPLIKALHLDTEGTVSKTLFIKVQRVNVTAFFLGVIRNCLLLRKSLLCLAGVCSLLQVDDVPVTCAATHSLLGLLLEHLATYKA